MAEPISHNRNTLIVVAAVAVIVLLVAVFSFGGGRNNGQPSSPSGPRNPMQSDQGR